jgi:alkyl hydroperoxide reductase subunit AhpF
VLKKTKAHKEALAYSLINDYMDRISYQVWDATKEIMEEATRNQVEQQQKLQDLLEALQQMLKATSITKERRDEKGKSMILGKEAKSVQSVLTQLAVGHRIL